MRAKASRVLVSPMPKACLLLAALLTRLFSTLQLKAFVSDTRKGADSYGRCAGDVEAATAHTGSLTRPDGGKPPGFATAGRPPAGQQQPQHWANKPSKQWVLDGRIYNYKYAVSVYECNL